MLSPRGNYLIVLCDRLIFNWFTERMPSDVDISAPLAYHALFPPTRTYAVFRDKALRDKFDEALRALRQSGKYDRILAIYGKTERR